jgi:3D (Asp-Asp-Asp) domain-containing protein
LADGKRIRLMSTAYGPPWNTMNGTGVTKTGIDLRKNPKQYVVAVDPSVIPLGSKLKIPKNPFGNPEIVFTAADIGGAIKGNRLDFYDWRGRKTQMGWGTRPIEAYLVGQGKPGRAGSPSGGRSAGGATVLPGSRSSGYEQQQGGADLAGMISALVSQQRPQIQSGGLPDAPFDARRNLAMPKGYELPSSGGGPAPPDNTTDLIRHLLPALEGQGIPQAQTPDVVIRGGGGGGGAGGSVAPIRGRGGMVYPLGKRGTVIGTPHSGTHTLGDWQSDNAVDIRIPVGTPVYAAHGGKVTRQGLLPGAGGSGGGRFAGERVQLEGAGNATWYGHLQRSTVKLGQRVKKGQLIGYSGEANGTPHLHLGLQRGDPRKFFG